MAIEGAEASRPGGALPTGLRDSGDAEEGRPKRLHQWLLALSLRYHFVVPAGWAVVLLTWIALVPLTAVGAYFGITWLWQASENPYVKALTIVPDLFLLCVPLWAAMGAAGLTRLMAEISVSEEAPMVAIARKRVRETEEEALSRFEVTDEANLLPLLRYSRAQLDAYYAIGLAQTRRSFVQAVIAMWLGFFMLIAGIALYVAPGPLGVIGLAPPPQDFSLVILASAAIVEFISVLFLWVYRNTIGQLTFYYRLQMRSHTAILCFRMAGTMQEPDEVKRAIINSILDSALLPERPPPPDSSGIAALLQGRSRAPMAG